MNDLNPTPEFEEKIRGALQTPEANPEFVKRLRNELARKPAAIKPRFTWKPAWAFSLALVSLALLAGAPAAVSALKKLLGYVPEVGLVENSGNLRMLAAPVSATRDGVTLTITHAFAYPDHIELRYKVSGIAPENNGWQAQDYNANPTAFCGGVHPGDSYDKAGDARLRLPDGTILERDYAGKYPQNVFAMTPVYEATLPADANRLTLILDCIPQARLGVIPEHWEIAFDLAPVPAGTIVGEPVIEVNQPVDEEPALATPVEAISVPQANMTLERIVPAGGNTVLYLIFNMENPDPSLISLMPQSAYVIDSLGQKIPLRGSFIWQPFEHKVGSAFEFVTESKPAAGALTVVVEQVVAYYMPLYVEPPQTTTEDMTFTFDAGENPQHGQTWALNKRFTIAGFDFEITSAKAVTFADIQTPNYIDGSQGFDYGYQFNVTADPSLGLSVEMDIRAEQCWLTDVKRDESSPLLYTQLCKGDYPKGAISVVIREMSITLKDDLQAEWNP